MTTLRHIFIFLFILFCSCKQQYVKHEINPAAIALNNATIPLSDYIENADSCRKAISLLDSATAIDSNYYLGYENKLMFLYQLKQYEKAIVTNNHLIRLHPFAHDLYLRGGYLYHQVGDTASARRYLQKSLVICESVLDTTSRQNPNYEMLEGNRELALQLLNKL